MSEQNDSPQTLGEYLGAETPEEMLKDITLGEYMDLLEAANKGDEELQRTVTAILAYRIMEAADEPKPAQEVQEDTDEQQPGGYDGTIRIRTRKPYPQPEEIDPEFREAAKKAIEKSGGLEGFKTRLEQMQAEYLKEFAGQIGTAIKEIIPDLRETYKNMIKAITAALDFTKSDAYKAIVATAATLAEWKETHKDELQQLAEGARQIRDLAPFIDAELQERMNAHPEYAEMTTDEVFINGFYDDGTPIEDSPFYELIQRAQERKNEYEKGLAIVEDVERIIAQPVESLLYPLDKPNRELWDMAADAASKEGQLKIRGFDTAKKPTKGKKKDEAIVLYALTFTNDANIRITKKITPFDELVYIIVDGLRRSGNKYFSLTQIYKVMNEGRRPCAADLERIDESLTKMGYARIYIDNSPEAQVYKGIPAFTVDAPLLSFKRLTARVNGKLNDSYIQVLDDLPLMEFARGRQQITTLPPRLLAAPVSKTEKALKINKYLLDRIGRMKGKAASTVPRKMLYATIFDRCGISDSKPERTKNTIKRYLEHYKKCGWIKGYTESADGVTVQP